MSHRAALHDAREANLNESSSNVVRAPTTPVELVLPASAIETLASAVTSHVIEELDAPEPAERSPWMSVATAARYLDVSEERLRKLIQRREVPFYQEAPRCRVLLNRADLDNWMSRFRQSARAPSCRRRFN